MKLLKELCEAYGAPGFEDEIRTIFRREMEGLCDRIETDGIGNVIAIKEGKGSNPKKVMLAGHMDEIGFVVKHIDKDGFLKLSPLGGFDAKGNPISTRTEDERQLNSFFGILRIYM